MQYHGDLTEAVAVAETLVTERRNELDSVTAQIVHEAEVERRLKEKEDVLVRTLYIILTYARIYQVSGG